MAAALAAAAPALSQWSNDPLHSLVIADRGNDQQQSKIAATSDGGCYIGWFDHHATTWEVWLQRLDRHGIEQWPHNGVLVSNHPQVQEQNLGDWDLIVDSEDNCVLSFSDTRAGGDLDIYAYRVDPTGAKLWGPDGVALSDNDGHELRPRVCEASDGDFVFVWANNGNSTVRLQRLDRAGTPRYAPDGIGIFWLPGESPGMANAVPAENGSVILSWVRTQAMFGTRILHAQKFDVPGNPQWNAGPPVTVFDTFSLPLNHEPLLLADGLGGAVIVWHWTPSVPYSTRIQRLDAAGNERYPHNGIDVATNFSTKHNPGVAIDVATQECFVVWEERMVIGGANLGYKAQKFDLAGNRVWGNTGRTIMATGGGHPAPRVYAFGGGFMAFGVDDSTIVGVRVDSNGTVVWVPRVILSRDGIGLTLETAMTPSSVVLLTWHEHVTASRNVFAQNVGSDGALAPLLGAATSSGCGVNPAGSLTSGLPVIGTSVEFRVDNPLGTQAPGSIPFLVLATAAPPTFPCGVVVPGLGMSGAGANGEILVDLDAVGCLMWLPPWSGVGQPSELTLGIPLDLAFVGVSLWFQGALLDPTPDAPVPIGVTSGVRWTLGY